MTCWLSSWTPPIDVFSLRARNKISHLFIRTGTTVYCNLRFLRGRQEDVYSQHNGGRHLPKWICFSCLSLLGCGVASVDDCCPTFRDGPLLSYLRVEIPAVYFTVIIHLSCYFRKERVSGKSVSYSGVPDFKSVVLYGLSWRTLFVFFFRTSKYIPHTILS